MLHRRLPVPAAALAALFALAGFTSGCLPLPVYTSPGISGRVVDAATGRPIAGAVVVIRYDARHSEILPDRDLLGHVEVSTDAQGGFRVPRFVTPGISILPLTQIEARL